jgi:hypothetical protein
MTVKKPYEEDEPVRINGEVVELIVLLHEVITDVEEFPSVPQQDFKLTALWHLLKAGAVYVKHDARGVVFRLRPGFRLDPAHVLPMSSMMALCTDLRIVNATMSEHGQPSWPDEARLETGKLPKPLNLDGELEFHLRQLKSHMAKISPSVASASFERFAVAVIRLLLDDGIVEETEVEGQRVWRFSKRGSRRIAQLEGKIRAR